MSTSPWRSRRRSRRSTSGRRGTGARGDTGPEMTAAAKIVLVTGASRGIGAATVRLAAAAGYDVAVNYLRDKAAADAVVADVEKAGRRAVAVRAGVALEADVERLFATIDARLGRLTHLVCNTGITGPLSRIDALPAKAAREVLDINVFGAFLCARAAVARISAKQGGAGGGMVFISSAMATLGGAGEYVMYAASKGAIESLSLGLARELARRAFAPMWSSPARSPRESIRRGGWSTSPKRCRWGVPAPWRRWRGLLFFCSRSSRRSPRGRCCGWRGDGDPSLASWRRLQMIPADPPGMLRKGRVSWLRQYVCTSTVAPRC